MRKRKPYKHKDKLTFLIPYVGLEPQYYSGDDHQQGADQEEEEAEDDSSDVDIKEEINVFANVGEEHHSEDFEDALKDNSSQSHNAISSSSTAPTPVIQSGDALQLYFSSIYSTIKDFEPRNILILQKQIFDLVHEMQMKEADKKETYSNK